MTTSARPRRAVIDEDISLFVGDPRRCIGMLTVRNPVDAPLPVDNLVVRGSDLERAAACGPLRAQLGAHLARGEVRLVKARLELPPGTPPGRYRATLEADSDQPVDVEVHELRKTRLAPTRVSARQSAGASFELVVVAANLGNVPVVIPSFAALRIHEADQDWRTHFHAAARDAGSAGSAAMLDSFAARLAKAEPGLGKLKVEQGAGELPAQQARPLRLRIMLPGDLRARSTVIGVARIADAPLFITVYVAARDGDRDEALHDEANT